MPFLNNIGPGELRLMSHAMMSAGMSPTSLLLGGRLVGLASAGA